MHRVAQWRFDKVVRLTAAGGCAGMADTSAPPASRFTRAAQGGARNPKRGDYTSTAKFGEKEKRAAHHPRTPHHGRTRGGGNALARGLVGERPATGSKEACWADAGFRVMGHSGARQTRRGKRPTRGKRVSLDTRRAECTVGTHTTGPHPPGSFGRKPGRITSPRRSDGAECPRREFHKGLHARVAMPRRAPRAIRI
jgi:hypothetical protein